MDDLAAASVDEVREFFRTYYRPDNATLVIAGDIDPAGATALVTKYFGRIDAPARAIPRDIPAEPPATAPRRATVTEAWPMPVVVLAHHIPADGHPDAHALRVAAKVLSDGRSSRIYRTLVYETGMALAAFGAANLVEDPGLFYTAAVVQPGHTPAEAEAALAAELSRLRDEPVSEAELSRVKHQITRDFVLGRETVQQKATVLARASVLHDHDLSIVDGEFDLLQQVSAADIQRVARTYFAPETRLVIIVQPAEQKGGGS
jgi:zinc protease